MFSQTFMVIFLLFIVIQSRGQELLSMAQLARAGNHIVFIVLLLYIIVFIVLSSTYIRAAVTLLSV